MNQQSWTYQHKLKFEVYLTYHTSISPSPKLLTLKCGRRSSRRLKVLVYSPLTIWTLFLAKYGTRRARLSTLWAPSIILFAYHWSSWTSLGLDSDQNFACTRKMAVPLSKSPEAPGMSWESYHLELSWRTTRIVSIRSYETLGRSPPTSPVTLRVSGGSTWPTGDQATSITKWITEGVGDNLPCIHLAHLSYITHSRQSTLAIYTAKQQKKIYTKCALLKYLSLSLESLHKM